MMCNIMVASQGGTLKLSNQASPADRELNPEVHD